MAMQVVWNGSGCRRMRAGEHCAVGAGREGEKKRGGKKGTKMNVGKQLRSALGAHDIAASALGLSPDSFVPGDAVQTGQNGINKRDDSIGLVIADVVATGVVEGRKRASLVAYMGVAWSAVPAFQCSQVKQGNLRYKIQTSIFGLCQIWLFPFSLLNNTHPMSRRHDGRAFFPLSIYLWPMSSAL